MKSSAGKAAGESPVSTRQERGPVLAKLRNAKVARSAHAYVRGSTVKFYAWLDDCGARLPAGPSVWICGDCHLGNLGPLADANGRVKVQVRDLDQTVIGNPAHDLIRLGLSMAMASQSSDLPGVTIARALEELISGYEEAISDSPSKPDESNQSKIVQAALEQSTRRRWKQLARERLEDTRPTLPIGKHFWPLNEREQAAMQELFAAEDVQALVTCLKDRCDDARVELLDAAYWVKGCSSLGRLRYAALARVGGRKGPVCLIDIKEAVAADAPHAENALMPTAGAERVVAGARALSPNLGERLLAAEMLGKSVFVRELLPQDLKIEVEALSTREALGLAKYLGHVVGRAHGRQMRSADRKSWLRELGKNRRGTLEAPGWLWSSVVELIGIHEQAYLEHCRKHVLDTFH